MAPREKLFQSLADEAESQARIWEEKVRAAGESVPTYVPDARARIVAGLVRRHVDRRDGRVVRLRLTPVGSRRLARLTTAHLDELAVLASQLRPLWDVLAERGYPTDR